MTPHVAGQTEGDVTLAAMTEREQASRPRLTSSPPRASEYQ